MKTLGLIGAVVLVGIAVPIGCSLIGAGTAVGTAPGRMVSDTMRTENIKQSYEFFHTASQNFEASKSQVKQWKTMLTTADDPAEHSRLQIELAAIQQGCRNLAAEYNANSAMVNHGIFRGTSTPSTLDSQACE